MSLLLLNSPFNQLPGSSKPLMLQMNAFFSLSHLLCSLSYVVTSATLSLFSFLHIFRAYTQTNMKNTPSGEGTRYFTLRSGSSFSMHAYHVTKTWCLSLAVKDLFFYSALGFKPFYLCLSHHGVLSIYSKRPFSLMLWAALALHGTESQCFFL